MVNLESSILGDTNTTLCFLAPLTRLESLLSIHLNSLGIVVCLFLGAVLVCPTGKGKKGSVGVESMLALGATKWL